MLFTKALKIIKYLEVNLTKGEKDFLIEDWNIREIKEDLNKYNNIQRIRKLIIIRYHFYPYWPRDSCNPNQTISGFVFEDVHLCVEIDKIIWKLYGNSKAKSSQASLEKLRGNIDSTVY